MTGDRCNRKVVWILLASLMMLVVFADTVQACPTCKDGLHANHAAFAFAASVLLMMGMPFLIVAVWIFAVCGWRKTDQRASQRKVQLRLHGAAAADPVSDLSNLRVDP